ncbi:MAG TPA: hypothetical protein VMB84_10365 [Stellaceae bacterium]|nr:hypothetical protein [Stellaceae bacterium]
MAGQPGRIDAIDWVGAVFASHGYDLPPYAGILDFKIWEAGGPPKGTNYWYPPRDDVIPSTSGYPAPRKIGTQIYAQSTITKMIAMCMQQQKPVKAAMDWAASEVEGFLRS